MKKKPVTEADIPVERRIEWTKAQIETFSRSLAPHHRPDQQAVLAELHRKLKRLQKEAQSA